MFVLGHFVDKDIKNFPRRVVRISQGRENYISDDPWSLQYRHGLVWLKTRMLDVNSSVHHDQVGKGQPNVKPTGFIKDTDFQISKIQGTVFQLGFSKEIFKIMSVITSSTCK